MIQCKAKWPDVPISKSPCGRQKSLLFADGDIGRKRRETSLVVRAVYLRWSSGFFSVPLLLSLACRPPRPSSSPASSAACAGGLRGGKEEGESLVSLRSSDPLHLLHPTPCISDTGLPIFTMYFKIKSNLLAAPMFALLYLVLSQLGKRRF